MIESGKKAFTETENINYVVTKATKKECFCVQYSMPIYKTVKAESKMYSFWTAFRVIYWTEKFMQEMHNFLFQQCKIWHFLFNFFLQFILAIIHSWTNLSGICNYMYLCLYVPMLVPQPLTFFWQKYVGKFIKWFTNKLHTYQIY